MNQLQNTWNSFAAMLPNLLIGLLLIVVAWIVATLVRKAVTKGLRAVNFDNRLVGWGAVRSEEQGSGMIDMLGQVFYYLV